MSDRPGVHSPLESAVDPVETAGPGPDPDGSIEAYETDSGAVIFDAYQPLAWIESSVTVRIDEHV